jgi:GntR family transcriptional regulator
MARSGSRELRPVRSLHVQLATSLRERLREGEWQTGERLPTEAQLSAEYGVSRSTVRGALQLLETQGRTRTRHGLGTFVAPFGQHIRTGLQELQSMSETIRSHGFEPEMDYHSVEIRPASQQEATNLQCAVGAEVLAVQRAVLADGDVVAFSYDQIPLPLLGAGFDISAVRGSLFDLLESRGLRTTTAVAEIHAVCDGSIGWGDGAKDSVYLLLDQIHYTGDDLPVLASRTYFAEGRFEFSVVRVR